MKRVRLLLRVSSDKQLEADGDLDIQRQIILDYIKRQSDWVLDDKEYFEGSKSAYKNTAEEREVLQEALNDAKKGEYNILVLYKDDRVGRLMWDTPIYIMQLKQYDVDVYTVKDGLLSPESKDDIMGQMMLAFRYANAQKSSADTGMRVKDTAQKLALKGKFMGGKAPYGYILEYSGEISKHGRALKHPVIDETKVDVVKHIYDLSLNKEYGSTKIASELNKHEKYSKLAPNTTWVSGTVRSILTNPLYAGYTCYKRREKKNGKLKRLDSSEWIIAEERNEELAIIDVDLWNKTQEKINRRKESYSKKDHSDVNVIKRQEGNLSLIDVAYCKECGCKLTNGTKYNYWRIKETGEKKASLVPYYKCQTAWKGLPHEGSYFFRADKVEPIVYEAIITYIENLQRNENIFELIKNNQSQEKKKIKKEIDKDREELKKLENKIKIMESHIPDAMTGDYALSLDELINIIRGQKGKLQEQVNSINEKEKTLNQFDVSYDDWANLCKELPTWKDVFLNADIVSKRILVNKLIKRVDVSKDEITIHFKINVNKFEQKHRIEGGYGVAKPYIIQCLCTIIIDKISAKHKGNNEYVFTYQENQQEQEFSFNTNEKEIVEKAERKEKRKIDKIVDMKLKGYEIEDISKLIHTSQVKIMDVLEKENIPYKDKITRRLETINSLKAEGQSITSIARTLGVARDTVYATIKKYQ